MHARLAETMDYVEDKRKELLRSFAGGVDLYQWLIFVGHHEGRHRKQIERTLNSIPE